MHGSIRKIGDLAKAALRPLDSSRQWIMGRYRKIEDEVGVLSLRQLLDESNQWWEISRRNPPPGWTPEILRDQEQSLSELHAKVIELEGGDGATNPDRCFLKERLALYCVKQRRRHDGKPPDEVEATRA